MKPPTITAENAPTMAVMATYTDRELLEALFDVCSVMPNDEAPDCDIEGHDLYEKITVERTALREAFRRLATGAGRVTHAPRREVGNLKPKPRYCEIRCAALRAGRRTTRVARLFPAGWFDA